MLTVVNVVLKIKIDISQCSLITYVLLNTFILQRKHHDFFFLEGGLIRTVYGIQNYGNSDHAFVFVCVCLQCGAWSRVQDYNRTTEV